MEEALFLQFTGTATAVENGFKLASTFIVFEMKTVRLKVLDSSLKEAIGGDFAITLPDEANILHLIGNMDVGREDKFFSKSYPEYRSLLHMTWNPVDKRFYKQIALSAYTRDRKFFEVRKDPYLVLPDGLTIFLGLGLCKSEHEEVVDYETFQQAISED